MLEYSEPIISTLAYEMTGTFGKEKSENDPDPIPEEESVELPNINIDDEELNEDLGTDEGKDGDELFDEDDDYNN